jgi:hypothetical protein
MTAITINLFSELFSYKKGLNIQIPKTIKYYKKIKDLKEYAISNAIDLRNNITAPLIKTGEPIKIPITLIKKTSGKINVRVVKSSNPILYPEYTINLS